MTVETFHQTPPLQGSNRDQNKAGELKSRQFKGQIHQIKIQILYTQIEFRRHVDRALEHQKEYLGVGAENSEERSGS